jgi:hypothetical protein
MDDTGQDAREELAFTEQLRVLSAELRQAGGGETKAWQPGAPPDDWVRGS